MNKKERLRKLRKFNNNEKKMRNFNLNSVLLLLIIFGLGGIAYFLYDNGYFSKQEIIVVAADNPTSTPSPIPSPISSSPIPDKNEPYLPQRPKPNLPIITPTPTIIPPTPSPTIMPPTATILPEFLTKEGLVEKNMELKLLALKLINQDRLKAGLNKLELGSNPAAQIHAEDSALNEYGSHWMINGEKPYQVYSRTGGDSYIFENGASAGWTKEELEANDCFSVFIDCQTNTAEEIIYLQHDSMMNDDLICCNNGHRDNILNPTHLKVNIGIASNNSGVFHGFYQHFEGGHFTGNLNFEKDFLTIDIFNNTFEYKLSESSINIYYDPMPSPLDRNELNVYNDALGWREYWVGGGYEPCDFSECLVASILEPLETGYYYENLQKHDVIASSWQEFSSNSILPPDKISITANMSNLESFKKPGIYTVIIWGDNVEQISESYPLIQLSFTIQN